MREILPQSVVEVGHMGAAFAGRLVVREFGSCVEATFSSCEAPSFRQRLNEWHKSGGETSLGEPPPPFYGMGGSFPDKPKETDRERAMRRARQRLRFLIKAINADRMLTLTHRDNIEDFAESRKILAKFLAMCRREWSAWRFVGVPEPQQRGAWHWHFALPGWVNVHKLRAFWWRAHGRKVAFSDEGSPILLDGCLTLAMSISRRRNDPPRGVPGTPIGSPATCRSTSARPSATTKLCRASPPMSRLGASLGRLASSGSLPTAMPMSSRRCSMRCGRHARSFRSSGNRQINGSFGLLRFATGRR
jgi:hypothetical protein